MTCPFLKEARVGRCTCASAVKMIPRTAATAALESCTSPRHRECAVFQIQHAAADAADRCPYLAEPLTQFCSAAPVVKYIPYSESLLNRCGNDGYRYCELYLSLANAGHRAGDRWAGGICLPAHLRYAPNHMWFDAASGGRWHAGIDGLLAKVIGPVEGIRFATDPEARQVSAFLTVAGVEVEIGFPYRVRGASTHDYLRARPEPLTADPYGIGWLFEGDAADVRGLLDAGAAAEWMRGEVERLSEYLGHQPAGDTPATCCDGGVVSDGAVAHLAPERIRALFREFFPPHPQWEEKS
jgi:glycine cleavage system H lipoate-binding protein